MSNRTLHENIQNDVDRRSAVERLVHIVDVPTFLSTMWIAVLLANLFRDVHEILRPGFVEELADEGTVYGTTVSDATLVVSGIVLILLVSTVVLARFLPRRSNRRVNVVAAVAMSGGVLASWPKDADDLLFGTVQLAAAALIVAVCVAWRESTDPAVEHLAPVTS